MSSSWLLRCVTVSIGIIVTFMCVAAQYLVWCLILCSLLCWMLLYRVLRSRLCCAFWYRVAMRCVAFCGFWRCRVECCSLKSGFWNTSLKMVSYSLWDPDHKSHEVYAIVTVMMRWWRLPGTQTRYIKSASIKLCIYGDGRKFIACVCVCWGGSAWGHKALFRMGSDGYRTGYWSQIW